MSRNSPKDYGVAAVGSTRRFDVEIYEALDDPNDTQISIHAQGWSFVFGLSARDGAERILSFLREHTGRLAFSELAVGSFLCEPVLLIKDNEFADRFWLRTFGAGQMVEFVLASDDLAEFTDAIAQAVQDLQN